MGRYTCKCAVGYEADKGSKDNGIDIKCIGKNIIIFLKVLMRLSRFKITSEINHHDMVLQSVGSASDVRHFVTAYTKFFQHGDYSLSLAFRYKMTNDQMTKGAWKMKFAKTLEVRPCVIVNKVII